MEGFDFRALPVGPLLRCGERKDKSDISIAQRQMMSFVKTLIAD